MLGIFTGCGNKGNKETESQTDEKVTESVNSAENNTEAVSYTHLDVYKRQVLYSAKVIRDYHHLLLLFSCPVPFFFMSVTKMCIRDRYQPHSDFLYCFLYCFAYCPQYYFCLLYTSRCV